MYGVWKANKFCSGCIKCWTWRFNSVILCNAWYTDDICKRIHVALLLIQHWTRSHPISHISLQMQRKFN
jgi:hypothetical protein